VNIESPTWWPPDVGDRLRYAAPPGEEGDLWHVVAVFLAPDEDCQRVVARTWWPTKRRWHYEVLDVLKARVGLFRPDGSITR
jgi:hypothetical protein